MPRKYITFFICEEKFAGRSAQIDSNVVHEVPPFQILDYSVPEPSRGHIGKSSYLLDNVKVTPLNTQKTAARTGRVQTAVFWLISDIMVLPAYLPILMSVRYS